MAAKKETILPEWSHMIDVAAIESWPFKIELSPEDSQRNNLVNRLGLLAIDDCRASLTLSRDSGSQIVHVRGVLEATVRQNCVVTTEPVTTNIHEEFEAWYADPEQAVSLAKARRDKQVAKGRGEMPVLSEQEDPEPMIDGKIDLGELVTQYLSLSIDPYPHAEGAEYAQAKDDDGADDSDPDPRSNPFAALKDWKDRLK